MGNINSIENCPHTVLADPDKPIDVRADPTETGVYRCASHPDGLVNDLPIPEFKSSYDIFQRGCRVSRIKPCLGVRQVNPTTNTLSDHYTWTTYADVEFAACCYGTGLQVLDLVESVDHPTEEYPPARSMKVLGVCSKNCLEWFITDLALTTYDMVLVPLYDTLGPQAICHMLKETGMSCISGPAESMCGVLQTLQFMPEDFELPLKHCIIFGGITPELRSLASLYNISLFTFQAVSEKGKEHGILSPKLPTRESVSTICYTSGTTGMPKGALITQGAIAANVAAAIRGPLSGQGLSFSNEDTYLSYLPLAHVLERILIYLVFVCGGRVAIYSGEAKTLLDDIRVAKPTVFASVPRLYMRINDRVNSSVKSKSLISRVLFEKGIQTKIENLRTTGATTHPWWDRIVFNQVRQIMGGRLRFMLVGGAALDKVIQERMACLFCCPLLEGYGLTESMGATFIRRADDGIYGHIGMPLPSTEIKLVSVPEMNYLVTDDPPAGELYLRGFTISPGYFMNPVAKAECMLPDGWFRTGDIAIRLPQGGRIKIIDRRKNIFKLAQGEYIAPERLENIYAQCSLIAQIFVHGDTSHLSLVAIVCADEDEARKVLPNNFTRSDLKDKILAEMALKDKEFQLRGFEKVRKIFVEQEVNAFSVDNGLLTPTFKLKRNDLVRRYQNEITTLHQQD